MRGLLLVTAATVLGAATLLRSAGDLQAQSTPLPQSPAKAVGLLLGLGPYSSTPCYKRPTYSISHGCPITPRLQRRLQGNPGIEANPVCRCQAVPARVIYFTLSNTGSVALVRARLVYSGTAIRLTFVVLHGRDGWRVDDIYCTEGTRRATTVYRAHPVDCSVKG